MGWEKNPFSTWKSALKRTEDQRRFHSPTRRIGENSTGFDARGGRMMYRCTYMSRIVYTSQFAMRKREVKEVDDSEK